jgi:iron complex outermembrane receptor protein
MKLNPSKNDPRRYQDRALKAMRMVPACLTLGRRSVTLSTCIICLLSMAVSGLAQKPNPDLTTKSLEDLMNIEVTSVSKKEEKLFQSAAAVYVITSEDIRRSGLSSIPDLLRMAPGLDVARIDGSKWAISARGFNGRVANKLLVLIDGRSIYSPETSGVFWEVQDLPLEDIERIEVIRGTGGTVWGANAVNGVINIITKRAQDTQGGLITVGAGTARSTGVIRYGGKIGENAYYRVYGQYFNRRGLADASGSSAQDAQDALRSGGRIDWQITNRDSLTLEGDIYHTDLRDTPLPISIADPFAPPINRAGHYSGGSLLGRWTRTLSEHSDMQLQLYYDRFNRDIFELSGKHDTIDVEFQHHIAVGRRQDVVWGLSGRFVSHRSNGNGVSPAHFNPGDESTRHLSIFAQDDFQLVKDRLRLTLGSKLEHFKDLEGTTAQFDAEPSVRLLWTPRRDQTVWAAISRAVRTPARSDTDLLGNIAAFPGPDGMPNVLAFFGNHSFKSETVLAYEAGYRVQPKSSLSVDIATFYNSYDRLQTHEPGAPYFEAEPQPAHVIIPIVFDNLMRGETHGAEALVKLNPVKAWVLSGSYSYLRMHLHPYAESRDDTSQQVIEGSNPQHQFQIHSSFKLPRNVDMDASLYHVSRLAALQVPSYTRLDVQFAWRVSEGIELSAGGQNLLNDRHAEFAGNGSGVRTSLVKRNAYAKITWRF